MATEGKRVYTQEEIDAEVAAIDAEIATLKARKAALAARPYLDWDYVERGLRSFLNCPQDSTAKKEQ